MTSANNDSNWLQWRGRRDSNSRALNRPIGEKKTAARGSFLKKTEPTYGILRLKLALQFFALEVKFDKSSFARWSFFNLLEILGSLSVNDLWSVLIFREQGQFSHPACCCLWCKYSWLLSEHYPRHLLEAKDTVSISRNDVHFSRASLRSKRGGR